MHSKKALAVAISAACFIVSAGSASADIEPGVGTPFYAESVTPIALGSIYECDIGLGGVIAEDRPAAAGGALSIESAVFSGCNVGTFTPVPGTLPWNLDFGASGVGSFEFTYRANLGSGTTCDYEGTLWMNYNNATGNGVLSGSVTRTARSGFLSGLCGATEVISGALNFYDTVSGLPPQIS